MQLTIEEAKDQLAQLIWRANRGEEIVICDAGVPVRLVPTRKVAAMTLARPTS